MKDKQNNLKNILLKWSCIEKYIKFVTNGYTYYMAIYTSIYQDKRLYFKLIGM